MPSAEEENHPPPETPPRPPEPPEPSYEEIRNGADEGDGDESETGRRPYVRLMAAVGGTGAVALVVAAVLGATTEPEVPAVLQTPIASALPTDLLPSGRTDLPLPSGYPSDWLTGIPTSWPTSWPTGDPSHPYPSLSFPSLGEPPTDTYPSLPSDWLSLPAPAQGGDAP
ncbi:hypothetical protein ACWDR3_00310 [Streptomyces sp. NPDC001002]